MVDPGPPEAFDAEHDHDWAHVRKKVGDLRRAWLGGGAREAFGETVLKPLVETFGANLVLRAWSERKFNAAQGTHAEHLIALQARCAALATGAGPKVDGGLVTWWIAEHDPQLLPHVSRDLLVRLDEYARGPLLPPAWVAAHARELREEEVNAATVQAAGVAELAGWLRLAVVQGATGSITEFGDWCWSRASAALKKFFLPNAGAVERERRRRKAQASAQGWVAALPSFDVSGLHGVPDIPDDAASPLDRLLMDEARAHADDVVARMLAICGPALGRSALAMLRHDGNVAEAEKECKLSRGSGRSYVRRWRELCAAHGVGPA